jgi:hypothetical protein
MHQLKILHVIEVLSLSRNADLKNNKSTFMSKCHGHVLRSKKKTPLAAEEAKEKSRGNPMIASGWG